jgi:hypothetical protein
MKKKRIQEPAGPVISSEILEKARESAHPDRVPALKQTLCSVCGADSSPASDSEDEPLCWVCRRLKISAWHESEQQMPAQE